MSNGYRWIGGDTTWRGVPSRDLSQDDFERLGPLEQRTVTTSGAWEAVKGAKPDKPADAPKPDGGER